jgi:hypothetical protein
MMRSSIDLGVQRSTGNGVIRLERWSVAPPARAMLNASMPTISMFYGILIRMFFKDVDKHSAPHIHAEYQGKFAVYAIDDGRVLAGELPPAKHKLVAAWVEIHKDDLEADWALAA